MKHLAANIRPEFLKFIGQAVVQNQEGKCGGISRGRSVIGNVVDIGNGRSNGIADRFRVVEVIMSRIRPSDKEPVDSMVGAVSEAPFSQLVVPWIFMEQAGEDSCRHVSADAVVGTRRAKTLTVGIPPLSPLFWIILCLCYSGEDTVERIGPPIENAGGCQSEFLAGCERGKLLGVFDCPVVRQDLEDAIINGSCFFLELALSNRPDRFAFIVSVLTVFRIRCLRIRGGRAGLLALLLLRQGGPNSD